MRRPIISLVITALLARCESPPELIDVFASMASALSEANPQVFLRAIDPTMPGYARLAANVNALINQNEVSNSVQIASQTGDDRAQMLELDWLIEISGKGQSDVFVRREAILKCRLERRNKKWRIVALEPLDFFAPPGT